MNLSIVGFGSCSHGFLWENHTLYAGKILIWQNFGHLRPTFDRFLPKLTVLRVFDLWFPTTAMNLSNFCVKVLHIVLTHSWELIILCLCREKVAKTLRKSYSICQENSGMAKFWPFNAKIWPFLAKIDSFESFWHITSKGNYDTPYFLVSRLSLDSGRNL